ncbi:MAG: DUF4175 family protein [Pseudomonadota bacterium]
MADLSAIKGLKTKLRFAYARLWLLRVFAAFGAALVIFGLFLAAASAGLFDQLPPQFGAFSALAVYAATIAMVLRGRKVYRAPTRQDVSNSLEAHEELRPLSGLQDRPSVPSASANTLWKAHRQRLIAAAQRLPVPGLWSAWARMDRFGLGRTTAALFLVGTVLVATLQDGRWQRALFPDYGSLMGGQQMRIEAWITPPAYARRPPVFLRDGVDDIRVPTGSEITVRAQARSAPVLRLKGASKTQRVRFEPTPDGAFEITTVLSFDAVASVRWWGERAAWQISTSPDAPPISVFTAAPSLGENDRTVFGWSVSDDYGVEKLELALQLVEPHPAAPDDERRVSVELPGPSLKEASDDAAIDMTRHAWAGLEVVGRLVATDGAGQEGMSAAQTFVLPEKLFLQPLARATQDIRVTVLREPRDYSEAVVPRQNALEFAPEGIQSAAFMLEAVTFAPEKYFDRYGLYLGLTTARGTLTRATSRDEATTVDSLLWAIALKAEYGSAADALEALLAAKRALEKALREGASEEEIARLTQAFRQAAESYVQAKLAEAIANGLPEGAQQDGLDNQQAGGGGPSLGQNSFEDMLNALEDLTETGASDQARQLLADITNMLENLEFQQGNGSGGDGFALPNQAGGEGEEDQQSAEEQELSQELEELADSLREQRELNDDTLDEGRRNPSGPPGQGPVPGGNWDELAERQAEIREQLEEFVERQGGAFGDPGEDGEGGLPGGDETEDALADALRAQRRAEDALRNGDSGLAQRSQERAVNRLRDVAGELADALDALQSEEDQQAGTDPFGRQIGGANDANGVDVPDEAERQRALDILRELRRRYGDPADEDERNYLERLLDRF